MIQQYVAVVVFLPQVDAQRVLVVEQQLEQFRSILNKLTKNIKNRTKYYLKKKKTKTEFYHSVVENCASEAVLSVEISAVF